METTEVMKRFKFLVFDEKWEPVFYTGLNLQMVHVADAQSEIEAVEKCKNSFVKGVNFKLQKTFLLESTK